MNTAIALKPDLWTSLVHLFQGFCHAAKARAQQRRAVSASLHRIGTCAPQAIRTIQGRIDAPSCATRKPVRVLRVVESGSLGYSAGRMVISGRMADVCAELDRLAAAEVT